VTYRIINPESLGRPSGWNHGMLAPAEGRLLFVAGQTAREPSGEISISDFVEQFERALQGVLAVVREAGGGPEHIGRLNIYVTDLEAYLSSRKALGVAYRGLMGKHYPAMVLLEVNGLADEGALVEIEATAVLP
jgi:enamine deaminase RidA (YjgF/YER057c/UK114 family)